MCGSRRWGLGDAVDSDELIVDLEVRRLLRLFPGIALMVTAGSALDLMVVV